MAGHPPKLNETLAVKIDADRLTQFRKVADADGMEAPELVRLLIDRHLDAMEKKYRALDLIFGHSQEKPKGNLDTREISLDTRDNEQT